MTSHVAALIGHDCLSSALSPADYKVLSLLQKGCAYQVRGAWRFRGSRTRVKERALVSVLEQGLAERVETGQHRQVKITLAGCCALKSNHFAGSVPVAHESATVTGLGQVSTCYRKVGGGRATSPKTYRRLGLSLRSPMPVGGGAK
jgi:hypothetical protein